MTTKARLTSEQILSVWVWSAIAQGDFVRAKRMLADWQLITAPIVVREALAS